MTGVLVLSLATWRLATHELLLLAAIGIIICGIDDLFVDFLWIGRTVWRRLTVYRRYERLTAERLVADRPGRMAIFVPAWDESAVIGAMLTRLAARLDHGDYRVFVGAYPNDPATQAAVRAVGDGRIQLVINSRPGSTTKADCLNTLWQALLAEERASARRFKAIVLHDAEDVVHPLELRIFDALMPRLGMVQLPVLPLPDPGSRWISGHYLNEFAESHAKDLVVREALGAAVPSAGVGCAVDRDLLGRIAAARDDRPFDPECMTEDYELGHRIKQLGGKAALVRLRAAGQPLIIATREHFPATFEAALQQKSRWLAGIALHGWDRIGWPTGWADRYMLWRDRKALLSPLVIMAGYLAAILTIGWLALTVAVPAAAAMPPVAGPALRLVLAGNALLLGWRLAMRFGFTAYVYGLAEGFRAVPRALVANAVNAVAALRALDRYNAGLAGSPPPWGKTAHRFPEGDAA